jgi:hypothetical protein
LQRVIWQNHGNTFSKADIVLEATTKFAAIDAAIGDGSSASVSYIGFRLDHHIARKSVSPSLKLLDHLGLVDISPGPRLVNVFRFSNRWRTIDEVEAARAGGAGAGAEAASNLREATGAEAGEATEADDN